MALSAHRDMSSSCLLQASIWPQLPIRWSFFGVQSQIRDAKPCHERNMARRARMPLGRAGGLGAGRGRPTPLGLRGVPRARCASITGADPTSSAAPRGPKAALSRRSAARARFGGQFVGPKRRAHNKSLLEIVDAGHLLIPH
jgi:hypothetical protein